MISFLSIWFLTCGIVYLFWHGIPSANRWTNHKKPQTCHAVVCYIEFSKYNDFFSLFGRCLVWKQVCYAWLRCFPKKKWKKPKHFAYNVKLFSSYDSLCLLLLCPLTVVWISVMSCFYDFSFNSFCLLTCP